MSKLDRHLTTEELSALLDDQRSTGETEEDIYRAHLQYCEQCQLEFADLRQTVRLLRSLPTPKLPRSFALPADIAWEVPATETVETPTTPQPAEEIPATPISLPERRRRRVPRSGSGRNWRPTLRLISGLVAIIGICFMLSTLQLPHFGGGATASSSFSTTASSGNTQAQPQAPNTSNGQATPSSGHTNHPPANGSGTQPSTIQQGDARMHQSPPDPSSQFLSFFAINDGPGRLRLGLLLLIIGGLGIYIFKQKYRYRWR